MKTLSLSKLWSKILCGSAILLILGWGFFGATTSSLGAIDVSASECDPKKTTIAVKFDPGSLLPGLPQELSVGGFVQQNPIAGNKNTNPIAFYYPCAGSYSLHPEIGPLGMHDPNEPHYVFPEKVIKDIDCKTIGNTIDCRKYTNEQVTDLLKKNSTTIPASYVATLQTGVADIPDFIDKEGNLKPSQSLPEVVIGYECQFSGGLKKSCFRVQRNNQHLICSNNRGKTLEECEQPQVVPQEVFQSVCGVEKYSFSFLGNPTIDCGATVENFNDFPTLASTTIQKVGQGAGQIPLSQAIRSSYVNSNSPLSNALKKLSPEQKGLVEQVIIGGGNIEDITNLPLPEGSQYEIAQEVGKYATQNGGKFDPKDVSDFLNSDGGKQLAEKLGIDTQDFEPYLKGLSTVTSLTDGELSTNDIVNASSTIAELTGNSEVGAVLDIAKSLGIFGSGGSNQSAGPLSSGGNWFSSLIEKIFRLALAILNFVIQTIVDVLILILFLASFTLNFLILQDISSSSTEDYINIIWNMFVVFGILIQFFLLVNIGIRKILNIDRSRLSEIMPKLLIVFVLMFVAFGPIVWSMSASTFIGKAFLREYCKANDNSSFNICEEGAEAGAQVLASMVQHVQCLSKGDASYQEIVGRCDSVIFDPAKKLQENYNNARKSVVEESEIGDMANQFVASAIVIVILWFISMPFWSLCQIAAKCFLLRLLSLVSYPMAISLANGNKYMKSLFDKWLAVFIFVLVFPPLFSMMIIILNVAVIYVKLQFRGMSAEDVWVISSSPFMDNFFKTAVVAVVIALVIITGFNSITIVSKALFAKFINTKFFQNPGGLRQMFAGGNIGYGTNTYNTPGGSPTSQKPLYSFTGLRNRLPQGLGGTGLERYSQQRLRYSPSAISAIARTAPTGSGRRSRLSSTTPTISTTDRITLLEARREEIKEKLTNSTLTEEKRSILSQELKGVNDRIIYLRSRETGAGFYPEDDSVFGSAQTQATTEDGNTSDNNINPSFNITNNNNNNIPNNNNINFDNFDPNIDPSESITNNPPSEDIFGPDNADTNTNGDSKLARIQRIIAGSSFLNPNTNNSPILKMASQVPQVAIATRDTAKNKMQQAREDIGKYYKDNSPTLQMLSQVPQVAKATRDTAKNKMQQAGEGIDKIKEYYRSNSEIVQGIGRAKKLMEEATSRIYGTTKVNYRGDQRFNYYNSNKFVQHLENLVNNNTSPEQLSQAINDRRKDLANRSVDGAKDSNYSINEDKLLAELESIINKKDKQGKDSGDLHSALLKALSDFTKSQTLTAKASQNTSDSLINTLTEESLREIIQSSIESSIEPFLEDYMQEPSEIQNQIKKALDEAIKKSSNELLREINGANKQYQKLQEQNFKAYQKYSKEELAKIAESVLGKQQTGEILKEALRKVARENRIQNNSVNAKEVIEAIKETKQYSEQSKEALIKAINKSNKSILKQTTENQELRQKLQKVSNRITGELKKELTKLNLKVPEELGQTLEKLHTDLADKMLSRQMLSRQPQESEQQPLKAEEFVKLNNIVPFSRKEIEKAVVGVKPG